MDTFSSFDHDENDEFVEMLNAADELEKQFSGLYREFKYIDRGGTAIVFSAVDSVTSSPVAIKVIDKAYDVTNEVVMMKKCAGINNIVSLLDVFESDSKTYLILSKPKNCCDLYSYLEQRLLIEEGEARILFKQLVTIVTDLFNIGVVHNDIKQENIIIDLDINQLMLIDFGYATDISDKYRTEVTGTWDFRPIEYCREHKYKDEPYQVWCLGVVLYEMICGNKYYTAQRDVNLDTMPAKLSSLLKRLLDEDPEARVKLADILSDPWFDEE